MCLFGSFCRYTVEIIIYLLIILFVASLMHKITGEVKSPLMYSQFGLFQ